MTFFEFLLECIIKSFIIFIWYRNTIFCCISSMSAVRSMVVLVIILLVFSLIWDFFLVSHRNEKAAWCIAFLTFGIYTVVVYKSIFRVRIIIIMILTVLATLIFCGMIWHRKIPSQKDRKRVVIRRIYRCMTGILLIMAIASGVLIIPLMVRVFVGHGILKSSIKPVTGYSVENRMLEDSMDLLLLLQEDKWSELDVKARLSVLQTVANIERGYLGISHELIVVSGSLKENILAQYEDATHTIIISLDLLERGSAHDALEGISHECEHAYQARLVEAYENADEKSQKFRLFDKAKVYKSENESYQDGTLDYEAYYFQEKEADARSYSKEAVEYYYRIIDEYLNRKDQNL